MVCFPDERFQSLLYFGYAPNFFEKMPSYEGPAFITWTRDRAARVSCCLLEVTCQWRIRNYHVEVVKSMPYVSQSHPFVERLIGTRRRESLDDVLFWYEADLDCKLSGFRVYYNEHRAHRSLAGNTAAVVAGSEPEREISLNRFDWQTHCRGLFQLPLAA